MCKQGLCSRTFTNIKSLYNHIYSKHVPKFTPNNKSTSNSAEYQTSIEEIFEESAVLFTTDETVHHSPVQEEGLAFILRLYKKVHMTRSDIDQIVNNTIQLLDAKIMTGHSLDMLNTEHKRLKILKKEDLFITPRSLTLGYTSTPSATQKAITCQYIPPSSTFKKVLSCSNMLDISLQYMESRSRELSDCKDEEKLRSIPPSTLPFLLSYDELKQGMLSDRTREFTR